jgi:hypothetical protein
MAYVPFSVLWANHPSRLHPPVQSPCNTAFENQCAIRMGVCLTSSGVPLNGYQGTFCWFGHGRTHPIRAEELARWLDDTAPIVGRAEISRRKNGKQASAVDYSGRQGIVLFRNFWGPGNQGDHIDLWNGTQMAHGDPVYFNRSEEIWFWDMTVPALW